MRFADRSGSSAVANAIMVKSGTRKKTNDRLIGCFTAFKKPPRKTDHGANRMSRSAKRHQESQALSIVRTVGGPLNLRHGSQIDQLWSVACRQEKPPLSLGDSGGFIGGRVWRTGAEIR